jgi:hypothetical protein
VVKLDVVRLVLRVVLELSAERLVAPEEASNRRGLEPSAVVMKPQERQKWSSLTVATSAAQATSPEWCSTWGRAVAAEPTAVESAPWLFSPS